MAAAKQAWNGNSHDVSFGAGPTTTDAAYFENPAYTGKQSAQALRYSVGESSADAAPQKSSARSSGSKLTRTHVGIIVAVVAIVCLVAILAGLGGSGNLSKSTATSSASSVGGSTLPVFVVGNISDATTGHALRNASIVTPFGNFSTNETGTFSIWAPVSNGLFTFTILRDNYAPQIVSGNITGADSYSVPVALTPIGRRMAFDPTLPLNFSYYLNMSTAYIYIAARSLNTTSNVAYLRFAEMLPEFGPGQLSAEGGTQLQSAGMFYFDVVDATNTEIAFNSPAMVSFVYNLTESASNMTGGAMMAWDLNTGNGMWANPNANAARRRDLASDLRAALARRAGFWNADRRVATSCVRGRIVSPAGASCPGSRISAAITGVFTAANSDATSNFCLDGVVGSSTRLTIGGGFVSTIIFPRTAGSCASNRNACYNVGTLTARSSSACPPAAPPLPIRPPAAAIVVSALNSNAYCGMLQQSLDSAASIYASMKIPFYTCCLAFTVRYGSLSYSCQYSFVWPSIIGPCSTMLQVASTAAQSYTSAGVSVVYSLCGGAASESVPVTAAPTSTVTAPGAVNTYASCATVQGQFTAFALAYASVPGVTYTSCCVRITIVASGVAYPCQYTFQWPTACSVLANSGGTSIAASMSVLLGASVSYTVC